MKAHIAITMIATLMLSVSGCSKPPDNAVAQSDSATSVSAESVSQVADDKNEIAWFEGTVDEAFAYARQERRPIFLYWGAVWCPPCHEIKVTVFDTPDFVQRSRLFVSVYLDGDTENAQATGERFGVLGYPTMIVFTPDGEEITRIPGGIDIEAYATILDLTLANARPIDRLLAAVLDEGAGLSEADCRLVAFYSWGQNPAILQKHNEAGLYRGLYDACPAGMAVERSRLYLNYLDQLLAAADDEEDPTPLTADQKSEALTEVNRFLDNYRAVKANVYSALFDGARITRALTEAESPERQELESKYQRTFARILEDESVFKKERLYTAIGKIRFERLDDEEAEVSAALRQEIRELVALMDSTTPDPYERQTVINGAANVLEEAGMNDDARTLLTAEIGKSRQPYYFMASLADVEQVDGNHEQALEWYKRAYDAATGTATRFQWGTYYVTGLIEMTPEDTESIAEAVLSVVREIEAEQAFYQRSTRYLKSMEGKLKAWNTDGQYSDSIKRIRTGVLEMCADIPVDKPARSTCEGFLETA